MFTALKQKFRTSRLESLNLRHASMRVLSLGDQILFSAANFILTLALAKYYSDVQVAGFGIGLSIALIIQSTQRTSYVVQNSILSPGIFRRRASKVLGQHLIVWAFIIAAELAISAFLLWLHPDAYHWAILCSTVICSLIYAQLDFDRLVLIKHDKIIDPFLASVAFLIMNVILFVMIPRWQIGFLGAMGCVGLYAILKIARLVMLIGRPDFFWGWRLACKDARAYFGPSLLGIAGAAGYTHVPLFILGHANPPLQAAAYVATRGLMQPVQVIMRSFDVIDKNVFQAAAGKSPAAMRTTLFRQLMVYGGISLLAIAGVAVLGPWALHFAYGNKYADFFPILLGWSVISMMLALTLPLETVIVKLNRLTPYNSWRLIAGAGGTAIGFLLCPLLGAAGAILATLSGWLLSIACSVWVIRDVVFGWPLPDKKRA